MGLITGSTAPLTGLVVNVRPETEDGERVLGLFLNTLPIRVPLVPGTWIDLARRAFEHENELLDYRRIPLSEIIRRLGGRPLFETFFNYSHFPGRGGSFLESLKPRSREGLTVDIDFTLSVDFELEDHTGQILLSLIYDVDQLCEPQVRRIADYLSTALEALADRPDARWDVSFASDPKEYTRLTREWVSGPSMADVPGTVPEMIERSAARTPNAIAVRHDGRGLSYQELDRRANQLAHHLRALGVEPEHRVAVNLDRNEELIVCLLAIGKAGAAYLPLNPHDPHSRREFLLSDSRVTLVLTQQGKFEPACSGAVRILRIDQEARDIASQPTHSPGLAVHPSQAAYVLYTSGSTGRPKPVVIPHAAVANLLNWSSREFRAEEFSGTLAATPLGFDLSVFEIFAPLVNGGTVIVAEDLFALPRLPDRDQVSMVNTVPSLLAEAMRLDRLPPRVRSVNLAGEPLPKGLVLEVFDQSSVETVRNLYGPTEATVYATCRRIGRAEPGPFSIGRPIAGVRTYVVDANLTPVPEGEPGELLLGGACLARLRLRPGDDRGAVRPRSLRPGPRTAPVPDRGHRPMVASGHAGVSRPAGPPGQGARLSRRAGGDRGLSPRASLGPRLRGPGLERCFGPLAFDCVCHARVGRREPGGAGPPSQAPAPPGDLPRQAHDPLGMASLAQWQGRCVRAAGP